MSACGSIRSLVRDHRHGVCVWWIPLKPSKTVQRYTLDICEALNFLHENEIIHRDVKPHNILLRVDGTCKLCDFGASIKANEIKTNAVVGTVQYIAPEQSKGNATFGSDILSFGIMVIQLLVGSCPTHWKASSTRSYLCDSLHTRSRSHPRFQAFCPCLRSNS